MRQRTMSLPEAAEFLGISRSRMKKLVDNGTIPAIEGSGKGNRRTVSRSMVLSYASQRGKNPTPIVTDMSTWQGEAPNAKPRLIEQLMAAGAGVPKSLGMEMLLDGPTAEDLELDEQLYCLQNNEEYRPRIIIGLRPSPSETVIHTDNEGVVEWLGRRGIYGSWLKGELQPSQVRGKHVIAGLLPIYIQVECRSIATVRARGVYIRTATADELEQAGAELVAYLPPRMTDNPWDRY